MITNWASTNQRGWRRGSIRANFSGERAVDWWLHKYRNCTYRISEPFCLIRLRAVAFAEVFLRPAAAYTRPGPPSATLRQWVEIPARCAARVLMCGFARHGIREPARRCDFKGALVQQEDCMKTGLPRRSYTGLSLTHGVQLAAKFFASDPPAIMAFVGGVGWCTAHARRSR